MSVKTTKDGSVPNLPLYTTRSTDPRSPYFVIRDKPVTITGVNLEEDDVITFYAVKVHSDTVLPNACDCTFKIPQPNILGEQQLICPDCIEEVGFVPIRLTANNPVVILTVPHGVAIQANYEGQGLGKSTVWIVEGAMSAEVTPEMAGCPNECCEDLVWYDTCCFRCNLETDQKEQQQVSNCGRIQWVEVGPLNWQDTGEIRCDIEADLQQKKQVNDCGDVRWVDVGPLVWTDTGALRCNIEDDVREIEQRNQCGGTRWIEDGALTWTPTGVNQCGLANDTQSHQEVNDCGDTRWVEDGTIVWTPTGETRCLNHVIQNEEINVCGHTRWVNTTEACGFEASFPIPGNCGWAYREGDTRDPAATVELEDCDGEGLSLWLYPTPNTDPLATIPVFDCIGANCPNDGEPLGYARNAGPEGAVDCDKTSKVEITGVKPYVVQVYRTSEFRVQVWSDGREVKFYDPQYCASMPLADGFGYRRGDLRDPEATVLAKSPDGDTFYMYPTPRVNASIPYLDGYLCNFSNCYGAGSDGGNNGLQLIDTFGRTIPGEK